MSTKMITIGINASHDASVCLMEDNKIIFAISEERLNKQKHYHGLPEEGLKLCIAFLVKCNYKIIQSIVVNNILTENYDHAIFVLFQDFTVENYYKNPSHHLLHCLYAISICPAKEGVVLVADGSGNSYGEYLRNQSPLIEPAPDYHDSYESISTYYFNDHQIVVDNKTWGLWVENSDRFFRFPSLGHMYGLAAQHIFGDWQDAGKVMGLAPFGKPEEIDIDIIRIQDGEVMIQTEWILSMKTIENPGAPESDAIAPHLAAKVQDELQKAMLFLSESLWEKYKVPTLCISGGIGLNTVCNEFLLKWTHFEDIVVTPASGDNGVAIGAALYAYWHRTGKIIRLPDYTEFMGFEYDVSEIAEILEQYPGISFVRLDKVEVAAALDISQGKVVGWFEGKSEFGPRALGHRSILANPAVPEMPSILNERIKFREGFRPFAVSVLEEALPHFFKTTKKSPWMMFVVDILKSKQRLIPAAAHIDGSCRIQTVDPQYPGKFRRLLEAFYEISKIPLVINTSLNLKGMPISETPLDALQCLLKSEMDVLYIGPFRVEKINYRKDWDNYLDKIVYVKEDILLYHKQYYFNQQLVNEYGYEDMTTKYRFRLSLEDYQILVLLNKRPTLKLLSHQLTAKEITCIQHFLSKGVVIVNAE